MRSHVEKYPGQIAPGRRLCNRAAVLQHAAEHRGTRKLKVGLPFTKQQITSLPILASIDKVTVDEFLTNVITQTTESEIRDDMVFIRGSASDTLYELWDDAAATPTKKKKQPHLSTYRAALVFTLGQIKVIRRLAAINDMTVEEWLSEQAAIGIRGLVEAFIAQKMMPRDEGVKIYKAWGGDDQAYLE